MKLQKYVTNSNQGVIHSTIYLELMVMAKQLIDLIIRKDKVDKLVEIVT